MVMGGSSDSGHDGRGSGGHGSGTGIVLIVGESAWLVVLAVV